VRLAEELLKAYEHVIESVTLVPSDGGRFEVTVNGQLLYSKLGSQRHAEPGEVLGLFRKLVGE
jgi:selenoprotein W-related protein